VDGKPVSAAKPGRREGGKVARRGNVPWSQRTRIPSSRPRSELVVTPRANGGVSIAQGPVYVLVGPKEIEQLVDAMKTCQPRRCP
jgi:hypothetical protein